MAFVAAAMFVSCGKTEKDALTVKFNKEQWTAEQVLGKQDGEVLGMEAYETNYNDAACASVFGTLGTATGTYNNYLFYYQENAADTTADGYCKWDVDSHSQEITAIDLAAHTIDAEVVETLKQDGKDNADLKITMNNASWTVDADVQTKGMAKRR